MPQTKDLAVQIKAAVDALRQAAEKQEEETKKFGEATEEQKSVVAKINDDITALKAQLDEMATKNNRTYEPGEGGKKDEGEEIERKTAFLKWMREGKAAMTREEKALVEDTIGEVIVPEDLDRTIYTAKQDAVVMRKLASTRQTSSDRIRRVSMNDVTAGWGKLETDATRTLEDFESTLTPEDAWLYVENLYGLTKIGEDELMDADINLIQYLSESFRKAFVRLEGKGFLRGEGHTKQQPEGLLTNQNIKRVTTEAAAAVSVDDFLKLMYGVHSDYRAVGSFLTSSEIELALRTLKNGNGDYVWQPSVQQGMPNKFLGKDIHVQDDFDELAADVDVAVFGDIKAAYQILDRKGLTLTRLNEKYIEDDLVGFKAKSRVGGGVVREEAVSILKAQ